MEDVIKVSLESSVIPRVQLAEGLLISVDPLCEIDGVSIGPEFCKVFVLKANKPNAVLETTSRCLRIVGEAVGRYIVWRSIHRPHSDADAHAHAQYLQFSDRHWFVLEASTAKYIVQQYLAATGGQSVLNAVNSMYAVGQVKMVSSDIHQSGDTVNAKRNCEVGGFVLWQKNPDLWFLELVVSGCKVSAGSDGKVAWSQSSSYPSQASKGPPRPLRRFFQ
ncbi:unnamed protein product [Camellia sinensis]